MTDQEKEELKATMEELPKEQLVQKILELREKDRKMEADLVAVKSNMRQLQMYFNRMHGEVQYFLTKTLPSRYAKEFKLVSYLKILWRICSTEEEQGFCFSPAHKRFIRCVDAAVVAGKYSFEAGEENDKEMLEQDATNRHKDMVDSLLNTIEHYKDKAEELTNAES